MKRVVGHLSEIVGPWVCARTGGEFSPIGSSTIGLLDEDGTVVAGAVYDNFNGTSICVHLAGEGRNWLNREFLRAGFRYPFDQLKVKKLLGLVPSTNMLARRFDEHCGFQLEAVVTEAAQDGADLLIYSMRRENCRFL